MVRLVIRAKLISQDEIAEPVEQKAQWRPVPIAIAGVLLVAIVGAGVYLWSARDRPVAKKEPVAAARVVEETPPASRKGASLAAESTASASKAPPLAREAPAAINQVIPTVPPSARATISGTIRVSVRVTVGDDGHVVTATSDDPGPSRYFERLSLDAAKKWTFSPGTHQMLVRFNYTRSGATADASPTR